MERRTFLTLLIGAPGAVALASCGADDDAGSTDDDVLPEPDSTAGSTTGSTSGSTVPDTAARPEANADAGVVLRYALVGGFTTRELAFQTPSVVLVTDDQRVITQAVTTAEFPGPLLPQHMVRTITPAGVDALLDAAREAGLFNDIEYETDPLIADAANAVLTINAGGETYEHSAYALGLGGPPDAGGEASSPERQALLDFVSSLGDLEALVDADQLGAPEPYVPEEYLFIASAVVDLSGYEVEPAIIPWPADVGVALADAAECTAIERNAVGDLFEDGTQLTFFTDGDVTYQVAPKPAYPGATC